MRYVPYKSTNVITHCPKRHAKLQKNRLMHQWHQDQHHAISFWGVDNIYRVLTAPNGAKFTICQVIMSTKSAQDLITPLFIGVNVSLEGNVIIICDIGIKGEAEAEAMLSHFGIYIAVIFGSVVWEAFTVSYKASMEAFQYCPVRNCAIKRDTSTIALDELSLDREFSKCGFTEDVIEIPAEVEFNLKHQMTLHLYSDIVGFLGDENGDSGTIRSIYMDTTITTSKTAPSTPINYLILRPKPPIFQTSKVKTETPTVTMSDPTDKADAPRTSPTPATTALEDDATTKTSVEEASSNRSKGSRDD
mmetsp:Transcript_13319/g.13136  ORF Transcript_13319/g.13136 Transcript_13319/m.13136 type:complete len:304 (-) Transcript_13319:117-1028(-)